MNIPIDIAQTNLIVNSMELTPYDLLKIAIERDSDLNKLETLMNLQERYEINLARKAFIKSMAAFKKSSPKIVHDATVNHSGIYYTHATLGNICAIIIPLLANYGISHNWMMSQPPNAMIFVACILTHEAGHSESTCLSAPPDNTGKKNTIQSIASTVHYLQRYTLLAACGLSTIDMDDDAQNSEPIPVVNVNKKILSNERFEKAIEAVKKGTCNIDIIKKNYELTTDQEIAINDAFVEFNKMNK